MKRMLILAVAVVALVFTTTDASAQSYNNGYAFGTGVGQAFSGNLGGSRFSAPPYFAQHPPVYYSGIVRRPYGISPYAAPPGIKPVELSVPVQAAQPLTIRNPFVNQSMPASTESQPVRTKKADVKIMNNKTTWVKNPFYVPEVEAVAQVEIDADAEAILLASVDIAGATLIELAQMATFKFN